jgi:hypothetical protein
LPVHIEFEQRADERQLRQLAALGYRPWRRVLFMAGVGAGLGAGFSFAAGDGRATLGGFLSAWAAVLLLYLAARLVRSSVARLPSWVYAPARYLLDDAGVTVAHEKVSRWASWEAFNRVGATKRFLLLQGRGVATVAIPLPELSPEQVQQIHDRVGRGSREVARQPLRPPVPDRGE